MYRVRQGVVKAGPTVGVSWRAKLKQPGWVVSPATSAEAQNWASPWLSVSSTQQSSPSVLFTRAGTHSLRVLSLTPCKSLHERAG